MQMVAIMQIDYKLNDKFDLYLFGSVSILIMLGLLGIYSSTRASIEKINFIKQLISLGISLVIFFVVYSVPTKTFRTFAIPAYSLSIILLFIVLLVGRVIKGAKGWINFGGFSFQPAEFAKIATILTLAWYLSKKNVDLDSFKDIIITLCIGLFPVGLILLEPDLGSSFVFLGVILVLMFWKGISLFGLFVVLSPALVAVGALFGTIYFFVAILMVILILFIFKKDLFLSGSILGLNIAAGFFVDNFYRILSPHQQLRIKSFIDPNADPLGSGYNSIQAKVAIGSGGIFGKGFLNGNQTQLQYIPEQWTDFIFCVVGEEFGFLGSILVLSLFLFIFIRILRIASQAKDEYISFVVIGILSVYFIHFVINIGMVLGILPVIGLPLPFVSYGGSSLLINMAMLGIVFNIYRTRKNYT
jgi:rod shape determining protein RodA